jgi:hypothetical protein
LGQGVGKGLGQGAGSRREQRIGARNWQRSEGPRSEDEIIAGYWRGEEESMKGGTRNARTGVHRW